MPIRKAMIVDDDHLVRSYLKMLPSWGQAGFQIVADARDGEEALGMLERLDVDLLVTDISMPLVNGIELIRKLRRTDQRIYIIALSCHDEFEYVKDAMKEGASDYVLKNTLNEDTLRRLLEGVAEKLSEQERRSEEQNRLERLAKAGDHQLKYAYFSKVIGKTLERQDEEEERRRAGIRWAYRSCGVICIRLESWEGEAGSSPHPERRRYCQEFLHHLREGLDGQPAGNRLEIVYWGKGLYYGFLDLSDLRDGSAMQQRLMEAAAACSKVCGGEPYPYGIGVSAACLGADAIRTAYRQAKKLMKLRFYDQREILYYDAGRKTGTHMPERARDFLARVEEYRYQENQDRFTGACMEVCESFEREFVDDRLVQQWLQELELRTGLAPEKERTEPASMEEVRQRLRDDARRLYRGREPRLPEGVSRTVRIAAEFVQEHYTEPIGLSEAAAAAGVNATYLSYLFHREIGVGFSNFLLNRRLEHAKELLRGSNLKVRETAEQSGFQDYHYFAKVFKKVNGLSPAEYRKQAKQG